MRLSLTYFAITHNKPAFAIETSKNIKELPLKVYYQLRAIEEYMKIMNIGYKRDFNLSVEEIKTLLKKQEYVVINNNTILPLKGLVKVIKYFPLTSKKITYFSKDPLVAVVKEKDYYVLYEGNNRLAVIYPQYFNNYCHLKSIEVIVDGKKRKVNLPSVVDVKDSFEVLGNKRVNVIGYSSKKNESFVKITKSMLQPKFSIDVNHSVYRVEIYDKKSFCGMFLVRFKGEK